METFKVRNLKIVTMLAKDHFYHVNGQKLSHFDFKQELC